VRVRVYFSPSDRQVQPRPNLCNESLLPQDALVCEERVLAGLFTEAGLIMGPSNVDQSPSQRPNQACGENNEPKDK
jgi:hypothetical protein